MPIADIPFEQGVVAVATKWTGDETVEPLAGVDTPTHANPQLEQNTVIKHTNRQGVLTLIFNSSPNF
jgi:hypothetical protein